MGKKILLADDSITIQKVIELTFSDEDFEVVTVGNGRLAVEKLEEVRPDVVLCDIIMPEKDGYEVCDYIKKHPTLSYVPVLLLTGAFEPFDQERASRVGCDGFLAKPFEPQALIAKVKDLLAQSAARPRPAAAAAPAVAAVAAVADETEAETMPRTRTPTSFTQPVPPMVPSVPATASGVAFVPEERVSAGTFDAPMELATGSDEAAAPVEDLYAFDEPVVAAPEEFMPLMADEVEALQPPALAAPAFAPESEATFEPEPAFEPPPPPPAFIAPSPIAFEPPRLEPAAFAPVPAPEPVVEEDDGASTVVFRAGETPPWSQPTTELSFEMRAQAMAKQQGEPMAAPVFEAVEEEPIPSAEPEAFEPEPAFEPPPPPPAFEPEPAFEPPPPPPAFVPPPAAVVFEPAEVPAPPPAPVVEEPEESFAALAPPPRVDEAPAPSAAAEVGVPVDQVAQIAQRVIAQISEKIVREIAWEVVPDLAEALIKKEIERLKAELDRT